MGTHKRIAVPVSCTDGEPSIARSVNDDWEAFQNDRIEEERGGLHPYLPLVRPKRRNDA
jgi:hypothetical protein